MSLIRRALASAVETRGADPRMPWGDSTPPPASSAGAMSAGIPITQGSAQQIACVYGCCALLGDSVASLPTLLRDSPDKRTAKILPPSPLLAQPYAEISRADFWTQFTWALALRGNFYGQIIERDGNGYAVQVKPVHNDGVEVRRLNDGSMQYRFYGLVTPNKDVVHVRYQSTAGNIVGLNPIQVCALAFGLSIAQDRYAESFFLNSANPQGVIQIPGPMDQTETRKMLRGWLAAHQGLNQAHLPAILTEGAEFKPITISPSDSQLLDALGFSENRIAGRIFRVPPHMVGMVDRSTSWGKGIEQQERGFFTNTLVGYLNRGAEMMTALHPPSRYVGFETRERLRGTAVERAQTGSLAMLAGAWTADDFRDQFDMPPLPDGQGKYVFAPINTELLLQALKMLTEPTPTDTGGDSQPTGEPVSPSGASPAARNEVLGLLRRSVGMNGHR